MNKNQEQQYRMHQIWKDTITYLEGKLRGLNTLIGLISDEADAVIEHHKNKVRKDLDFAYEKIEQYEQEIIDYARKEG